MDEIVSKLINTGRDYIDGTFKLISKTSLIYIINGEDMSTAVNIRKNNSQMVNVLNWFDDFWIYIEIRFIPKLSKKKMMFPNVIFSLSIFQGTTKNSEKTQLYRAEWDNYENQTDEHPQPHWHIYPHMFSNKTQKDFKDFAELKSKDNDFKKYNEGEIDEDIININRVHFAMNGKWSDNEGEVHSIHFEKELIYWFAGLLNHLKKELLYIKEKS